MIMMECEAFCRKVREDIVSGAEKVLLGEIKLSTYKESLNATLARLGNIKADIEDMLCTSLGSWWSLWVEVVELESFASDVISACEGNNRHAVDALVHNLR